MIKYLAMFLFVVVSNPVLALETIVNKPQGLARGLVVIAPTKKYLMKERLFAELAASLAKQGFIAVRFNWEVDTLVNPALEQQKAARDIQYITTNAQRVFGFGPRQTVLISKSFSTKSIEPSLGLAKFHILLTPNCSADAPFYKTYGNILNKLNGNLKMIISNEDPYCNVNEIRQTVALLKKPELLVTTKGDHNFVIIDPATKTPYFQYQDGVIAYTIGMIKKLF